MELPAELRVALQEALAERSQKELAQATAALSRRYRAAHPLDRRSFLHTREDVLAYAAYRLPATYAAVRAALEHVRATRPAWQPQSLFDIGAGLGSGMWAATAVWPGLGRIAAIERDERMSALGEQLAAHSPARGVRDAVWLHGDLLGPWQRLPSDLVVASYVLREVPATDWSAIISELWSTSTSVLVIVEPGTPEGFSLIRQARQQLIVAGATAIAPCPHSNTCPMQGDDWCHFAQRIARTTVHRRAKDADLSYEDEKYSYIAASREPGLSIRGRVIRHPQARPGYISLRVCTPAGLTTSVVTRRDREAFRAARDVRWGSAIEE